MARCRSPTRVGFVPAAGAGTGALWYEEVVVVGDGTDALSYYRALQAAVGDRADTMLRLGESATFPLHVEYAEAVTDADGNLRRLQPLPSTELPTREAVGHAPEHSPLERAPEYAPRGDFPRHPQGGPGSRHPWVTQFLQNRPWIATPVRWATRILGADTALGPRARPAQFIDDHPQLAFALAGVGQWISEVGAGQWVRLAPAALDSRTGLPYTGETGHVPPGRAKQGPGATDPNPNRPVAAASQLQNDCVARSFDQVNAHQGDVVETFEHTPGGLAGISWGQTRPRLRGAVPAGFVGTRRPSVHGRHAPNARRSAFDVLVEQLIDTPASPDPQAANRTGPGSTAWVLETRAVDGHGIGAHSVAITYIGRTASGEYELEVDGARVTYLGTDSDGNTICRTADGRLASLGELTGGAAREHKPLRAVIWHNGANVDGIGNARLAPLPDALRIGQSSGGRDNPLRPLTDFFEQHEHPRLRPGRGDPLSRSQRDYVDALAASVGVGDALSGLHYPSGYLAELAQMAWVRSFFDTSPEGAAAQHMRASDLDPLSADEWYPGEQYWRFATDPRRRAEIETEVQAQGRTTAGGVTPLRRADPESLGFQSATTASAGTSDRARTPRLLSMDAVRTELANEFGCTPDSLTTAELPYTIADLRYRALLRAGAVEALDVVLRRLGGATDPEHRRQLAAVRDTWTGLLGAQPHELTADPSKAIAQLRAAALDHATAIAELADAVQVADQESAAGAATVEPGTERRVDIDVDGTRVPVTLTADDSDGWQVQQAQRQPAPEISERKPATKPRKTNWLGRLRKRPVVAPPDFATGDAATTGAALTYDFFALVASDHTDLAALDAHLKYGSRASGMLTLIRELIKHWRNRQTIVERLISPKPTQSDSGPPTRDGSEYEYWNLDADPELRQRVLDRLERLRVPATNAPVRPVHPGPEINITGWAKDDVLPPVPDADIHEPAAAVSAELAEWGEQLGDAVDLRQHYGETLIALADRYGIDLPDLSPESLQRAQDELRYRALRHSAAVADLLDIAARFEAENDYIPYREAIFNKTINPLIRFEQELWHKFFDRKAAPGTLLGDIVRAIWSAPMKMPEWRGVNNGSDPLPRWYDLANNDTPTGRKFFYNMLRREQLRSQLGDLADFLEVSPTDLSPDTIEALRAETAELTNQFSTFEATVRTFQAADTEFGDIAALMARTAGNEWIDSQNGALLDRQRFPGIGLVGDNPLRLVVFDNNLDHDQSLTAVLSAPDNADLAEALTLGHIGLEYRVIWASRDGQVHVTEIPAPDVRHLSEVLQGRHLDATLLREGDEPWRVVGDRAPTNPTAPQGESEPPQLSADEREAALEELADRLGCTRADLEQDRLAATLASLRLENGLRALSVERLADTLRNQAEVNSFLAADKREILHENLAQALGLQRDQLTPQHVAHAVADPTLSASTRQKRIQALVDYMGSLREIDAAGVDAARDRLAHQLGVSSEELAPTTYEIDPVTQRRGATADLTKVDPPALNKAITNLAHRPNSYDHLLDVLSEFVHAIDSLDPNTAGMFMLPLTDPRRPEGPLPMYSPDAMAYLREVFADHDALLAALPTRATPDVPEIPAAHTDWVKLAGIDLTGVTPEKFLEIFTAIRDGGYPDLLNKRDPAALARTHEQLREEILRQAADITALGELAEQHNRTRIPEAAAARNAEITQLTRAWSRAWNARENARAAVDAAIAAGDAARAAAAADEFARFEAETNDLDARVRAAVQHNQRMTTIETGLQAQSAAIEALTQAGADAARRQEAAAEAAHLRTMLRFTALQRELAQAALALKPGGPIEPGGWALYDEIDQMYAPIYAPAVVEWLNAAGHDLWRNPRALPTGGFIARWKYTTDAAWIAAHGTDRVDIANHQHRELPTDLRSETDASTEAALRSVSQSLRDGNDPDDPQVIEAASEEIHMRWNERNYTTAVPASLLEPYQGMVPGEGISENEKDKSRAFARLAVQALTGKLTQNSAAVAQPARRTVDWGTNNCVAKSLNYVSRHHGAVDAPQPRNDSIGTSWLQARPWLRGAVLHGFSSSTTTSAHATIANTLITTGQGATAWILDQRTTIDGYGIGAHSSALTYQHHNPDGTHTFDLDGEQVTYHPGSQPGHEWSTGDGPRTSLTQLTGSTDAETATTRAAIWHQGLPVNHLTTTDPTIPQPTDDLHIGQNTPNPDTPEQRAAAQRAAVLAELDRSVAERLRAVSGADTGPRARWTYTAGDTAPSDRSDEIPDGDFRVSSDRVRHVPLARRWVGDKLAEIDWGTDDQRHSVMLVVSELTANSLEHSDGPVQIVLERVPGTDQLLIQVINTNPEHPPALEAEPLPDEQIVALTAEADPALEYDPDAEIDLDALLEAFPDPAPSEIVDEVLATAETRGRGRQMVDEVSDAWGLADLAEGQGKSTWLLIGGFAVETAETTSGRAQHDDRVQPSRAGFEVVPPNTPDQFAPDPDQVVEFTMIRGKDGVFVGPSGEPYTTLDPDANYDTADVLLLDGDGGIRSAPARDTAHIDLYQTYDHAGQGPAGFVTGILDEHGHLTGIAFGTDGFRYALSDPRYAAQVRFALSRAGVDLTAIEFYNPYDGELWKQDGSAITTDELIAEGGERAATMFAGARDEFWVNVTRVQSRADGVSITLSVNPVRGEPGSVTLDLSRENGVVTARYSDVVLGPDAVRVAAALTELHDTAVAPWLRRLECAGPRQPRRAGRTTGGHGGRKCGRSRGRCRTAVGRWTTARTGLAQRAAARRRRVDGRRTRRWRDGARPRSSTAENRSRRRTPHPARAGARQQSRTSARARRRPRRHRRHRRSRSGQVPVVHAAGETTGFPRGNT